NRITEAFLIASVFCICAVSCGADQHAPSAGSASAVLVEKPQAAMLWLKDLPSKEIWLIRLTPDTLTFRPSAMSAARVTDRSASGQVQAIQLASGDVFKVQPAARVFAHFDPVRRAFASETTAESSAAPDSLVEEAEGSGTTGDEAIRDALRNAVRKAVGVLVD